MHILIMALQVLIALAIFNVWLLRHSKKTAFRGGNAESLKDEFKAYGLPPWFYYFVGTLKICASIALILGIWIPNMAEPAALTLSVLMVGAIAMHIKVGDPWKKSAPAAIMLILCLIVYWGQGL